MRNAAGQGRTALDELRMGLHDGVLQLLEFLAVGGHGQLADAAEYRAIAALAAADLRAIVECGGALPGGLEAELHRMAEYAHVLAPHVRLSIEVDETCAALDAEDARPLVLAAREALNNAFLHAGARTVWVRCWCDDDGIQLVVRDDGSGTTERRLDESAGVGVRQSIMRRMAHAGGRAEIHTEPGAGTSVDLVLQESGRR